MNLIQQHEVLTAAHSVDGNAYFIAIQTEWHYDKMDKTGEQKMEKEIYVYYRMIMNLEYEIHRLTSESDYSHTNQLLKAIESSIKTSRLLLDTLNEYLEKESRNA